MGIVLTALIISLFFCSLAQADYFPPAQPQKNIAHQTFVSVIRPTNSSAFHINVTEYDTQQMVKNISIGFNEPVTNVGFVIDLLREKPLILNAPETEPVIQYYDIRFLTGLMSKITNVTVVFALEKATLKNMSIEEDSLRHYQYNEGRFAACPLQKVSDNKTHIFFETEVALSSCYVIAGAEAPVPWWSSLVPIALIILAATIGIIVCRKYVVRPKQDQTGR